jgi:uncharacterized protein (TIGR04222 family)
VATALAASARARRKALTAFPADDDALAPASASLDRYALGYLVGGAKGAVDVAITELTCAGALAIEGSGLCARAVPAAPTPLQDLVLQAVAAAPRDSLDHQRPDGARVRALFEPDLIARGLVVPFAARCRLIGGPIAAAILLGALVYLRLTFGPDHAEPPGWLLLLSPVFLTMGTLAVLSPLFRTRRGDAALERLRSAFALPARSSSAGADFAELVATFGAEALRTSTLVELSELLAPEPAPSYSGCGCGG